MANIPFPYIPSRSTAIFFESFDPAVFTTNTDSTLYKFLDALVGKTGAGSLLNQIFLSNLSSAIDTCYFNELDYIVGNIRFLARSTAESYSYDPLADQLTSDEWDEVRVKDAWFRARIKDFFAACQLGGTPEGIRKCVSAAIASDCTIQEVWRYVDNFDFNQQQLLGRSNSVTGAIDCHWAVVNLKTGFEVFFSDIENPSSAANNATNFRNSQSPSSDWEVRAVRPRNEVVIKPHKKSVSTREMRLLRELLGRLLPVETIITVNTEGLETSTPVPISGAAADSSYFEVIKQVIPSPLIAQMPKPEFLPIDLLPGEQWLFKKDEPKGIFGGLLAKINGINSAKREARSAAFQQTAQHSYYYLAGGGKTTAIDSVSYGTLQPDGSVKTEQNYRLYEQSSSYTSWIAYQKADSPDNYPGGQFGKHPGVAPAMNPDGTPYSFPYESQSSYVAEMIEKITSIGGIADQNNYKLPIQKNQTVVYTYYPEYAVANFPPTKESTVTASITRRRPRTLGNSLSDASNFVR